MAQVKLSIIIPTYNRSAIITKTLLALFEQELKTSIGIEILVIDDGSIDDTPEVLASLKTHSPFELYHLRQQNKGAAVARNYGIETAKGDIILFLDDDIIGMPSLLAEHLSYHERYSSSDFAVLGRVELSPEVPQTMLNLRHALVKWRHIKHDDIVDWNYFMTGNISVKRNFLLNNNLRFDNELPRYQDTEFGYRCALAGIQIVYNARACAYHYNDLSLEKAIRIIYSYGQTTALIHHRHPELRCLLADDLVIAQNRSRLQTIKELIKPIIRNRMTTSVYLKIVELLQERNHRLAEIVFHQVAAYYVRQGYKAKQRELSELNDHRLKPTGQTASYRK